MSRSGPKKSIARRVLRILLWTIFVLAAAVALLRGLVWLGERVPMIDPSGPEVVEGALTLRPIRFAQTDFWFYPPRVDAEEGRLRVPERRHPPGERSIEIRFVRFPSTAANGPGDPVVYLAGGPGGMGVLTTSGDRFRFFMKLREVGDVIALDQRGTASSDPYPVCPESWSYPFDRVGDAAVLARAREPFLRACWDHLADSVDVSAYNTIENAEDLEDLRIALGAERLNLVGISYGTHLALAYIRRHPDRVARAVLAGVEGPDHTYKLPSVVDDIVRSIDRTLEAEAGWKGFAADVEAGIRRLAAEPAVVRVDNPATGREEEMLLGPVDLKRAVYFGLGEREDFLVAARRVRRIAEGDDELLARFIARMRAPRGEAVMPHSMDCASGASVARLERIRAEQSGALVGDVANLGLTSVCPSWPVEDLGDDYRSALASDVPVLAVSGTLDLRTPPVNAEEVLSGFSRGRHLRIVGGAHGDDLLIISPEIGEAMVSFLRSGDPGRERIVLPPL